MALSEISAPEPTACAQTALEIIELAAQRDPWYAQFLEKFLALPRFSEEYTRELSLIAHMALTQAITMKNPLPLPEAVQEQLLKLFNNAIESRGAAAPFPNCRTNVTGVCNK